MRKSGLVLCCLMLAGCTRSFLAPLPTRADPGSVSRAPTTAATFKLLYDFHGPPDGANPYSSLTVLNGVLYGTTYYGGDASCNDGLGCGIVFEMTPDGAETVLYTFRGPPDGADPSGGLVVSNGALYSTTLYGGTANKGTVFKITTSGVESIVHSFTLGKDGTYPYAGVTNVNGTLYGTTSFGGRCTGQDTRFVGCGTVFKISPSGVASVLYRFKGAPDGAQPEQTRLLYTRGELFGTTNGGGTNNAGTIFRITTSGAETVLYRFKGGSDGAYPFGGLTEVSGAFYGTTTSDGAGRGTVFKLMGTAETVLYRFAGGSDGAYPAGRLVNVAGNGLFGTTQFGGGSGCQPNGCGTVYKITPSGKETVLYRFTGGADGSGPITALRDVNGTLYGTTGTRVDGFDGTVFSISL